MARPSFFKDLLRTQKQRKRYFWAKGLSSLAIAWLVTVISKQFIGNDLSEALGFIAIFASFFTIAHYPALLICAFEEIMGK